MSRIFIDRTVDSKNKSSSNRDKFIRRTKAQIKESVKDFLSNEADLKSISDGKGKRIRVSKKSTDEPQIVHSTNNTRKQVYTGNKEFQSGDLVDKPRNSPKPIKGSDGEGEDDFYFVLSHEEFLDIFFEGLELPDLIKKSMTEEVSKQQKPAGFSSDGPPPKLDLLRTMQNSVKRNFAIINSIDEEIEKIEEQLKELDPSDEKYESLVLERDELIHQKENIPFIQDLDLRYRKTELVKQPICKAVMIMLMDVSGSMGEWHKEMAKRFFMLLYLFLTKQYESVEVVFIKYHSYASEVDEYDFFYSRETGGTIVHPALELTKKIISERYDTNTHNIYISHASDGDIYSHEEEDERIIDHMYDLLPIIQYYAYVNIKELRQHELFFFEPELLKLLRDIQTNFSDNMSQKLACQQILDVSDIYEVFRNLFEKKEK